MYKKPLVAIVGRPNVGKSTFVNRLVGARESIVDDTPGVTRDRVYFDVEWAGKSFTVVDTGGIIPGMEDEIMLSIYAQSEIASQEADAIVFLVDGKDGINPTDENIANLLRRIAKKPIFLAVNKIDVPEKTALINDFYALGIGQPYPVSAMHGTGDFGDLLDEITNALPDYIEEEKSEKLRIAVVGKPNVGKSSLVNALLGEQRVIVSEVSGTTRDAIDTEVNYEGKTYILVDTAGIRKKAKIDYGIEKFSVARTFKAIRNCDTVILMIDAQEGLTEQDKKISNIVVEEGKSFVIAVNKWDAVENKDSSSTNRFENKLRKEAPFLNFAPLIFISAETKQRINKIFPIAEEVFESANKRISTNLLNKVIMEALALNPPPSQKGKRLRIYYSTQAAVTPPTFVLFVNNKEILSQSYEKYIENKLREAFGFVGAPIRIVIREKEQK